MDRYLFRGLRTDGEGWVYGYVLFSPYEVCIFNYREHPVYNYVYRQNEVIPETVGQWTGLLDKNGVKIFEGDYNEDGYCIVWCERCIGYECAQLDVPTYDICIPCHRCDGNFFLYEVINDYEVIGNIHEGKDNA